MNVSRDEQRVLHALAQGGTIFVEKNDRGRIEKVACFNRDGWVLPNCTLELFKKLRSKRAIASSEGSPYRISRRGLDIVRSQFDNQG